MKNSGSSTCPTATARIAAACAAMAFLWVAPPARPLDLAGAVRETLDASVELAAERDRLDASRESIGLSRASLLPQAGIGAQGQILDDDRADGFRGNAPEKSATVYGAVTQTVYDEQAWAGFTTQKHVFESERSEFESTRLGVAAEAAKAFVELEQALMVAEIQRQNREITRQNIETARQRVATGYSGERDVLRWQSQLSANDTAVVRADTAALASRFELNRLRNQPREAPIEVSATALERLGFVYARPAVAEAIVGERGGLVLRDFMVRVGLARSPDLQAIDARIEAEERQLTARRRAFWAPSLEIGAGVNYLAVEDSSGGQASDTNVTEWGARATLSFPIAAGGAKLSGLGQAQSTVSSLRASRRATSQTVEQAIRTAFAQASGSFQSLGFAEERESSAARNYDLANQAYEAGVSSILDLLDAQTQLLEARISRAQAHARFLTDLITAEQAIAYFPFLLSGDEAEEGTMNESALLDQLESELPEPG